MGTSITSLQDRRRGRRGVRPHAPAARRGAAAPRRRGDARRACGSSPRTASKLDAARARAAAQRGARAPRDRPDHGRRRRALQPHAGASGLRVVAAAARAAASTSAPAADRAPVPQRTTGRADARVGMVSPSGRPLAGDAARGARTLRACWSRARSAPSTSRSCGPRRPRPIGYEGLARFPYAAGLEPLPPDVTLAAARRARPAPGPRGRVLGGDRRRPARRPRAGCCSSTSPRTRSATPACFALADAAPVAAGDRDHRAGRDRRTRARPARAARAVARPRRAGGDRRRRRRLRVARARRRAAPRLPQAVPRPGHRHRPGPQPPGGAARARRLRPRGRRA